MRADQHVEWPRLRSQRINFQPQLCIQISYGLCLDHPRQRGRFSRLIVLAEIGEVGASSALRQRNEIVAIAGELRANAPRLQSIDEATGNAECRVLLKDAA